MDIHSRSRVCSLSKSTFLTAAKLLESLEILNVSCEFAQITENLPITNLLTEKRREETSVSAAKVRIESEYQKRSVGI